MVATTVVSETRTVTVELAVTDAPPVKADFVYYEVTGLRLTYVDDELTDLIVIGVASDSGETESLSTRMSAYEMVQLWIRDEVDKHRPSRRDAERAQVCQKDALDRAAEAIDGEAWPHERPERENEELYRLANKVRALPLRDICWCGREKEPGENHSMCYPAMD